MKTWSITLPSMKGITSFDPMEPLPLPPPRRPGSCGTLPQRRAAPRARGARAGRHRSRHAKAAEGDDPPPTGFVTNPMEG